MQARQIAEQTYRDACAAYRVGEISYQSFAEVIRATRILRCIALTGRRPYDRPDLRELIEVSEGVRS